MASVRSAAAQTERWAFICDWLDPSSGVRWTYQLFAYISADAPVEVEMFDIKNKRHFLKRVKCDTVEPAALYVGSTVTVFARQLHLIAFGDEASRKAVEARSQRTLALILPDAVQHAGTIINAISSRGFTINNLRMCQLSMQDAWTFLAARQNESPNPDLAASLAAGPVLALELMAASGIRKWLDVLGPEDVAAARQQAPDSLRAVLGRRAALGSDSPATAAGNIAFFFGGSSSTASSTAGSTGVEYGSRYSIARGSSGGTQPAVQPAGQTCCRCCRTTLGVVLPHAVKSGIAGLLLEEVQGAFQVVSLQQFCMSKQAAAEFLEVYKGVVPPGEFSSMVEELISGPCIAVEVATRDGREPVEAFRQLVGPRDPELARVLRPNTLRARFGVSRVHNAIHCTDLVEDGPLEASYFFSVLQQPGAVVSH